MAGLRNFWGSLVGKKLIAAFTGLILLLYLVAHVAGNLKALLGPTPGSQPPIDVYGAFLRTIGEPLLPHGTVLWLARVILLASVVVHVIVVIQLSIANRGARPVEYSLFRTRVSSIAAKSMMLSGLAILVFVVLHILHLTSGTIRVGRFEHGQIYANLSASFRQPIVALLYVGMMVLVGLHLIHGGWSLFQTWGFDNPKRNRLLRRGAVFIALAIALGFSLVPLLFLFGILPEPPALATPTLVEGR